MKLVKIKADKIENRLRNRPREYSKELNDIIVSVSSDSITIDVESDSYLRLVEKYNKTREDKAEKFDYCILCENKNNCRVWSLYKDKPCVRAKIWSGNPQYDVSDDCKYREKYIEQRRRYALPPDVREKLRDIFLQFRTACYQQRSLHDCTCELQTMGGCGLKTALKNKGVLACEKGHFPAVEIEEDFRRQLNKCEEEG